MDLLKRFGIWVGIALILVGFVLSWILGTWGAPVLIPLILGAVLAVTGVVFNWSYIREISGRQTTKYGVSSIIGIVIVLVIVVIANLILNEFNWRVDTTAAKQFSLADQTVKVLQNLEQDVEAIAFDVESNRSRLEDRLKEYEEQSSKFSWRFVDPDKKPEIAKQYNIRNLGTIVVEAGTKTERIDSYSEQNLTNALIKVTRTETKKVYFTTGHGEHAIGDDGESGLQSASAAIEEQNYVAEKLFLANLDSIPGDASVVVIPGPQTEFFDKEFNMLAQYIDKGGNVFFMLDPQGSPRMKDFLAKYYFEPGDNIVVDASGIGQLFGAGPTVPLVNNYGDHTITEGFGLMSFYPLARSMGVNVPSNASGYSGNVLAQTSRNSWGETDLDRISSASQAEQDPEDMAGPVPLASAMEVPNSSGSVKGRLVAFGDSDFATNRYFNAQGNGDLFMNSVNWLLQDEDLISVRPNAPEDRRIQMSQSQVRTVLILVVILLPVLILVVGGVMYWTRRR
ncbi:MAG: Gldg family protein [Candidatus Marinimicrobia bacterium]|nr:Gldg family protein [Candidatus Neomarinimicrobiota bacterium]MCF7828959.1 Gldg family protein [Candidatus Neomarinimicrobiota bacterium]MCF7879919.1 Gldg family protein [Candidatus Neomarinimicrobiota bacterium]